MNQTLHDKVYLKLNFKIYEAKTIYTNTKYL